MPIPLLHPRWKNALSALSLVLVMERSGHRLAAAEAHLKPALADKGALTFQSCEEGAFRFQGVLGQRIDANIDQWLLRAPQANPGLLEMFRVRDRQPVPDLVPWAGEFAGKYLISAIQALRMSENAALRQQVRSVIAQLIATQADDGYLGPFPKATRLKGNWDLWGHYHCMEALMMWHEATGDAESLAACRRSADLICRTFLDTPQRVFDAGSHEMNMAVIHVLGQLHRVTGELRYLRMMREIEKDWERAGDYFRSGLTGAEFFETPSPRWESIHDMQGLVELYRITGDAAYRRAFEHHWRSIVRWDRHNTGGFSSGEQATGNPYSAGAIETCCTVAWMAMTVDMLRVTGDPICADELEMSTFNGAAGAQHPSGRWWTYNTPMDGAREASAHTIVFQSRAGTPELNCCSVNAPRSLGMLSEWAVMANADGLVVNHYGPGQFVGQAEDKTPITLRCETEYPLSGSVRLRVEPAREHKFTMRFRIPAWSHKTGVRVNGTAVKEVVAGRYLELNRRWKKGDRVDLEFDMSLRAVTGDRESAGKVSLYRGPLLLAYDQRYNAFDEQSIPPVDLVRLSQSSVVTDAETASGDALLKPWLLVKLSAQGGRSLQLCDFASAGASGTRYRSWLGAENCPPPPVVTRSPADGAAIPQGPFLFKWTGPRTTNDLVSEYQLLMAETTDFTKPVVSLTGLSANRAVGDEGVLKRLVPGRSYYWKIRAVNAHGVTESVSPLARFSVDATLPRLAVEAMQPVAGPNGLLVEAGLRGDAKPGFGVLKSGGAFKPVAGPSGQPATAVELDGKSQMLTYGIDEFPEEDYTVSLDVRLSELPGHLGQIFSAWSGAMNDPLRICVEKGKLFARIETPGQSYSTSGVQVEAGRWYRLVVVKAGSQLTIFVDGKPGASANVPMFIHSGARDFALGGNPHYGGNEFLAAQFSGFSFYARALSRQEIASGVVAR